MALTEPRLVTLRECLQRERAAGASFAEAWEHAEAEALADLHGWHREDWTSVLLATRPAWRASYERRPSRLGAAVSQLEAYADSPEALRYEPVAASGHGPLDRRAGVASLRFSSGVALE